MVSQLDRLYYQREIQYLDQQGKVFAERYPEIAQYLRLHGTETGARDPHAERIVEAFAFLTGKLQRYLDAQFPELVHSLFEMVYPQYPRPLPSKTLVAFTPRTSMVDKPCLVEAGTELYADELGPDGERYTFTTCWDLWVQPVDLTRVYVDPEAPGDYTMSIELKPHPGVATQDLRWDHLAFTLFGDPSTCQNLFLLLADHLSGITIKGHTVNDPIELIWSGFDHDYETGGAGRFTQLHHLRDFFDYPQRFLFFKLQGLERALAPHGEIDSVQIDFRFSRPFETGIHLREDSVKTHCVVAQNLFTVDCEPFKADAAKLEHALAFASEREDVEIHGVERILATRDKDKVEIRPYYHFERAQLNAPVQWFYTLRRDPAPDRGWDCYARFLDMGHDRPDALDGYTISVRAKCTNRHYAQKLKLTRLNRIAPTVPETITAENITQATAAAWPPLHSPLEWDFLAHLALDFTELGNLDAVKTLLQLYHHHRSDAGTRKIKGLQRAHLERDYAIYRGCCIQGQRLELDVNGSFFASTGEVALFSHVLARFLRAYCPVNSFIKLVLTETETGQVFQRTAWGVSRAQTRDGTLAPL